MADTPKQDNALSKLFSPIQIGNLQVKNRLVMAPIGTIYSSYEGALKREFKEFVLARAKGGVGMIMLGDAGLGFTSIEIPIDPALRERMVKAARNLVSAVHDLGVCIGVQIHHAGRQPDFPVQGYELVGPSPIAWSKRSETPRELSEDEIEQLIDRYVDTAEKIRETGFDVVEIKACHGYLLSSFISPHSNRRDDQYGGDLDGRARIVLEIIRRIKGRLGNDLAVSCRINGADHVKGGLTLDESTRLAQLLENEGVDLLNVTAGVHGSFPLIISPFHVPQGCFVHLAAAIKGAVHVPVSVVGRIKDPRMGDEILQSGKADMVAMARALLADPDLPAKAKQGAFDDIRPCIGCNQGCQDRALDTEITCLVNPAAAREKEMALVPTHKPKHVMVIGGGPAGMETALIAQQRGHRVTLYEADNVLGGQWRLASLPPCKGEFADHLNYLIRQLQKHGVTLRVGVKVTPETVMKESPDSLVIATGALPCKPNIPGVERKNVVFAWDVLSTKAHVGEQVLVVGGNAVGLETADYLATQGKRVAVVEALGHVGRDLGPTVRWHLRHRLNESGVSISTATRVIEITGEGVVFLDKEGKKTSRTFDTVVLATGVMSNHTLVDQVNDLVKEIYVIGDAAKPRNALFAVREGAETGRKI
ncbi:MAG: FAD-dependent oxidoreductase [Deltaproteobacteria bacterium]|nr:FAD-dependent oxidoreductase [Deltaproteobacteria bacterium]